MKKILDADSDPSLNDSRMGLRDRHRRSIMRLIFGATGSTLVVFAFLQLFNDNVAFALFELVASGVLIFGAFRVESSPHLLRWIHGYLIASFSFFVYIIAMPGASSSAFVWIFIMPILSYLLLGRLAGFLLAVPFMLVGGFFYYLQLEALNNARTMIDLLNPAFCALLTVMFMHLYETRRAEAQDKLVILAETDALTGLPNRSNFQTTLERTVKEAGRSKTPFALVLMDIDHFKRVNDTLGHDAGDEVLRHISGLLSERLRETDFVGRLGGEEFGLILRDVSTPGAFPVVDNLRQRIESNSIFYDAHEVKLTASFGIAYWPKDAEKLHDLYQVADRRLYGGKRAGRNIVAECDEPPHRSSSSAQKNSVIG
ncbi:MAG: diguanylate cyclase [Marinobacter sp.]|uniref:GGDEF domain-containing protein n=1 Tax=Marinobacter sp. TaxID=50741 RepID=UPI00349FDF40